MSEIRVRIRKARSDAAEALERGNLTTAGYVKRTLESVREELRSTRPAERPSLAAHDPSAKQ